MTTMEMTAADMAVHPNRPRTSTARARTASTLAGLALAAAVAGGVVGATAATVLPSLTRDHAAEQARWIELAEQLQEAIRLDSLWRLMHPEPTQD